eukprot:3621055-Rhodomonas_salina.1
MLVHRLEGLMPLQGVVLRGEAALLDQSQPALTTLGRWKGSRNQCEQARGEAAPLSLGRAGLEQVTVGGLRAVRCFRPSVPAQVDASCKDLSLEVLVHHRVPLARLCRVTPLEG